MNHSARSVLLLVACCLSLGGVALAENSPKAYERTATQLSQAIESATTEAQSEAGYDVVFRRDPLRPLVDGQGSLLTSAGLQGGLMVQGIIWSDERPLAVIDDDLFAQGDTVGPYTIQQIHAGGVTVRRGNEEPFFIPLGRGLPPPAFSAPPASSPE